MQLIAQKFTINVEMLKSVKKCKTFNTWNKIFTLAMSTLVLELKTTDFAKAIEDDETYQFFWGGLNGLRQ